MGSAVQLFGDSVISKQGMIPTSSLRGRDKVIGIYFSAHWCPPCRTFTPQLAEWYRQEKAGKHGDRLEIVFVSSDRDKSSCQHYYTQMPWLCLPYEDRQRKATLSAKFGVQGIPSLVFVSGDGRVHTLTGRDKVSSGFSIAAIAR